MFKIKYYQTKFNIPVFEPDTDEFLESRKFAFGGSEIASIIGTSEYENVDQLIHKKKNKINSQNESTLWGKLFEPVSKIFISKKYGKIYNYGSIPHCQYPVSYSPDGLIITEDEKDIYLLEIKCPAKRNINSIPPHYMSQVLTGLCVINARECLFAQFKFRRCVYGTLPWSTTYDHKFHCDYRNKRSFNTPNSYGYLIWNLPAECTENKLIDLALMEDMNQTITDFKKKLQTYNEDKKQNEKFCFEIIVEKPVSINSGLILMWKLFDWKSQKIQPDKSYLQKYEEMLWEKYQTLIN